MELLGVWVVVLVQLVHYSYAANQACSNLKKSRFCGDFAGAYVPFANISDFDTAIASNIGQAFETNGITTFQCPSFSTSQIRYRVVEQCALWIDVATNNPNNASICAENIQRPPSINVCVSALNIYANTLAAAFNLCPPWNSSAGPDPRANELSNLGVLISDKANSNQSNCVSTLSSDKFLCGFDNQATATSYCSNSTDSCCSAVLEKRTSTAGGTRNTQSVAPVPTSTQTGNAAVSTDGQPKILGLSTPVFASVVGGGALLLIALVIGAFCCLRRRPNRTENGMVHHRDAMAKAYEHFEPTMDDEIDLEPGDDVLIKVRHDDGWAFGCNLTTNKEGVFPLACIDSELGSSSGGKQQRTKKKQKQKQKQKQKIQPRTTSFYHR